MTPAMKHPEVIEVYAACGFQRYITMKWVCKTKSVAAKDGVPHAAAHAKWQLVTAWINIEVIPYRQGRHRKT